MAGKSQKGRKIGRNKERPSQKVYTMAKRWIANAKKRQMRHTRRMAKKAIKKIMRMAPSTRDHSKLQELRHTISQNITA